MGRPRESREWTEKTVSFLTRVPESLKNRFFEICREEDTTAAREIRRYMKEFVNARSQGDLFKKGEAR
jgi:hypothetical protein